MTTVFIGGSRTVSRLNPVLRQRLDHVVKCRARMIIGDSNGADKAVQQFLAAQAYPHVTVYCAGACFNNLGNWPTRAVGMPKERALIADARCGLILWDGKSPETPGIVRQLLSVHKKVLLYYAPAKTFHNFSIEPDLDRFLAASCRR